MCFCSYSPVIVAVIFLIRAVYVTYFTSRCFLLTDAAQKMMGEDERGVEGRQWNRWKIITQLYANYYLYYIPQSLAALKLSLRFVVT